ncbi:MAG: hypothetical protein DWG76_02415 [Chloroflexi bacterium]|nr:hypothetical protein [Chloroflexota bacterium]
MNDASDLPAINYLEQLGIPFRIFVHQGAVHSLEQAAEERGQQPDQVVRSLLFRLSEAEFVLVLVAGPEQIPWKTLRRQFGQRRLTLASADEVLSQTGYRIGAVSPFGLSSPIPIYIESNLLKLSEISTGSGRPGTAIMLRSTDLPAALPEAQIISLFV